MLEITDPEKFQMASAVTKNSRTGFSSNRRLLVIKRGHLYYYTNIPKAFKGDPKILDSLHQLPKCSIEILNIKQIKGFQSSSSYFSIQFQSKHMMERQDIRKTLTLQEFNFAPKDTKEMVTWQFTCDNQFIKQKWVTALETLHAHYGKEKVNIQKFFENINKKQQQIIIPPQRTSVIPWRDDQLRKSTSNDLLKKKVVVEDPSFLLTNNLEQSNKQNHQTKKQEKPSKTISQLYFEPTQQQNITQQKTINQKNIDQKTIIKQKTINQKAQINQKIIDQNQLLTRKLLIKNYKSTKNQQ